MANNWFPVLTGFLGTGLGATLGVGADWFNARRSERAAVAAWNREKADEHVRWRRDRAVEAIEDALTTVSALRSVSHPDHEAWKVDLASCNLRIRLYCGPEVQGAFSSIKDSSIHVAEHPEVADDRVMLLLGEATKYLQITARFDLGIEGSKQDVEQAQADFLTSISTMRSD